MSITWLALAATLLLLPSPPRRRGDLTPLHRAAESTLPLALELVATALRAGQPLPAALDLAAPVAGTTACADLGRVAALLRLGAAADEAWQGVAESSPLAPLAVAARRGALSGARLAQTFVDAAADERARHRAAALARVRRAGVFAIAPLGLCFLPAFVCLGVIPLIVGIAGGALPGLP